MPTSRAACVEPPNGSGPTYIKLGQIISGGEGLFPRSWSQSSSSAAIGCRPSRSTTCGEVVEEDLGVPLDDVFASFDRDAARRRVDRPGARGHAAHRRRGRRQGAATEVARLVRKDLAAMAWLAPHLVGRIPIAALANPPALVELFAETIVEELDFRLEAANMLDIAVVLAELQQTGYVVPRPHPTLVTRRVLVMERLDGLQLRRRRRHAGRRRRHRGRRPHRRWSPSWRARWCTASSTATCTAAICSCCPTVAPRCSTSASSAGCRSERRLAFLRLMVGATTNDVKGQLAAMRDLGALPADTDLDAVIRDLRLDQPPIDPTTLTGDELVAEVQRVVKALLGYGARMPKELMLYVKNMVFLDGAIARLAPDLDLLAEIANISMLFAERHGERLGRELGIDQTHVRTQPGWRQGRIRARCVDRAADLPRAAIETRSDPETDARPSRSLISRREPRRERQPLLRFR